jgi:gamma-glutamyltranspeptidase / glutathione hydrolase
VLQVLEPHLNGPGGDMPAVLYSKRHDRVQVICAQGPAPAGATIEHYKAEGLQVIPGDGLLATVIPGAWDGWMLMLRDYGRLPLRTVLEPAIWYAGNGHPMLPRVADTIEGLGDFFREHWPTSYRTWLPGGFAPAPHSNFANPVLAQTWTRILTEAEARRDRDDQIDAARDAFYRGFVAEKIADYLKTAEVLDASGSAHRGVLTADDLAGYAAHIEEPLTYDYHGWTVAKAGPWTQGPVLLQSLAILKGMDLGAMDPLSAEFVHTVVEAKKLAFADREVYYGDPNFAEVPLNALLSDDYNAARRALISDRASFDLNPGTVPGYEDQRARTLDLLEALSPTDQAVYEPTMAHLSERKGDTVHIDVIDAEGNMVAITPSGGWLQSSPVVPGWASRSTAAHRCSGWRGAADQPCAGKTPTHDVDAVSGLKDGVPQTRVRHPWWRSAGSVAIGVLAALYSFGNEPAGSHRPAAVPLQPLPRLVLSARPAAGWADDRAQLRGASAG